MTLSPPRERATDAVLDKLQEPRIAAAVANLLDHADLVAVLLEGLDQFVARSDTVGESLFASVAELRNTVNGNTTLSSTLGAIDVQGMVDSAKRLAASDVVSPQALDSVATVARGLVAGGQQFKESPVEVTGLLSLARLLKDPDIRRALSYGATVARSIGQELQVAPSAPTHRSED
ncbi:MAG: DUF1641 domain-containing protein [Candidatus Nanopelagicales bacterium]|nr:DUF1641 domain-containing protein [Candidatus Nanopelagicales bacterium]